MWAWRWKNEPPSSIFGSEDGRTPDLPSSQSEDGNTSSAKNVSLAWLPALLCTRHRHVRGSCNARIGRRPKRKWAGDGDRIIINIDVNVIYNVNKIVHMINSIINRISTPWLVEPQMPSWLSYKKNPCRGKERMARESPGKLHQDVIWENLSKTSWNGTSYYSIS